MVKGSRIHGASICIRFIVVVVLSAQLVAVALAQRPKVAALTADDGLPSTHILGLAQDEIGGRLAVLTRAGVSVYDGQDFETYSHTDGLPPGGLGALTTDPYGRLWTMARWDEPIVCRLEAKWRCSPAPPLSGAPRALEMIALAVAGDEETPVAAIGSLGAGLWLWQGDREMKTRRPWQIWRRDDGLPSGMVRTVVAIGKDFAVGTDAGLVFLRDGRLEDRLRGHLPRLCDPIYALYSTSEGDILWILSSSWLGRLEADRLDVVADGLDLAINPDVSRAALLAEASGRIYFGTQLTSYETDLHTGRVRDFGRREGLIEDGVTAYLLDREANLWVGGPRGLSRIESRRFLTFDASHGLLEDEVTALLEPVPGRFVLGHNIGVTLLEPERDSALTLPFAAPSTPGSHRVMDMALDSDGSVWLAANHLGLLQLDPPFQTSTTGARPGWQTRLPKPNIFAVEIDTTDRLWAMGSKDLFLRQGHDFVPVEHGRGDLKTLRWLEAGPAGRLYVSTANGLFWNDGAEWRLARAAGHDANILYGLHASPSGIVWVGTLAGLYRLDGDALVKVRQGELEIDRPVYFILEDSDGRLWIGTDDGVFVWDGAHLRHLSVPQGLAGRETNRAAGLLDHQGRVWVGTDRGVSIYQQDQDRTLRAAPRVELGVLEVNGREQAATSELRLATHQKNLTFHFGTIAFSSEAAVEVRYRLRPYDGEWALRRAAAGEIRYTNLPPGRYRFHIAAGWADAAEDAWSPEASSAEIFIPRPLWQEPWILALATLLLVFFWITGQRFYSRALLRRAREREVLIRELEAKNAELERFTYTVSHDLKSPLVTIKGFLGLVRRDAELRDAQRMEQDLRQIEDAADQMGRLLNEVLELSRIGRVVGASEQIALTELVAESLTLLAGPIVERGVDVEVSPRLPTVVGDRIRLREVFQNLIENAVRFMGDEPHPRIEVGTRSEDGRDVIFVRDNGIGIDAAYREKVFGLFERLDADIEGTGIGLALVKRIVELHGGRIWVESEGPGRGSAFCFTLDGTREV